MKVGARIAATALLLLGMVSVAGAQEASGSPGVAEPVGRIVALTGAVQVGRDGQWQAAAEKQPLFETQVIKTGAQSAVEILFTPDLAAKLGEGVEIKIGDLLLKTQLEKTKAKITAPADATKVEMQVTPLTGVRGTEKSEEKAEDLKRDHYWNENAEPAKK